ncbi:large ribosomal subunit protein mL38-like [Atheta coriaria]|uniref:large ribosomal subunit protein mL38-like n=1 Tax=Dalotia coriaria TaxID=877792 RepID=UPI0031F34AF4
MFVLLKSTNTLTQLNKTCVNIVRNGHHLRGKPPGVAKSLQQRLEEINYKDPKLTFKVNIGFAASKTVQDQASRIGVLKNNRQNKELEKQSRNQSLLINLDDVKKEWLTQGGPQHIQQIAEHYGVFEHLFGDAYFAPVVPLHVKYNIGGDKVAPVYYGNVLKPSDTASAPEVEFNSPKGNDGLWTLIMTNPDGHLTENNKEYVHWFVGNIPGDQFSKGETIVNYLQSFPPKGTGFHRHIFVLYKQEKKLDFSAWKRDGACLNLSDRTFSTQEFYRGLQDDLTPAGLAFFQADWDSSLNEFYHNKLNMQEPIFEYDFPETYVKKQEWFPLREAFNLYMDRYRDPKQINKEFLLRKLKDVDPFSPPKKPLPYPNAVKYEGYVPSWLKLEKTKSRNKWGRINDI